MSFADEKSFGQEKLESLKKKIEATMKFYADLQAASLPESIIMVGDVADTATEKLVPHLKKKMLAEWLKRAAKIESVNDELKDFEFQVCEALTVSKSSVWFREIYKLFQKFTWVVDHTGEITLLLAASLGYASGTNAAEDFKYHVTRIIQLYLYEDSNQEELLDSLKQVGEIGLDMAKYLATSAVLGLIATILESSLSAFAAAKYATTIAPAITTRDRKLESMRDVAFPQGKGRVRRKKRSRKN